MMILLIVVAAAAAVVVDLMVNTAVQVNTAEVKGKCRVVEVLVAADKVTEIAVDNSVVEVPLIRIIEGRKICIFILFSILSNQFVF